MNLMRPRKADMYRLPWSLNDNPIGWLEITDKCNIYCRGCYRRNMEGHKSLEQIKEELRFFKEWRNCDNVSIAGGEPLIHPDILEILAYIRELGMKPLILSNGVALVDNKPFLKELKAAGAMGFTFHIDSEQSRPHWKGKSEIELCDLRLEYARMVAEVGGMFVSFGATIYPTNVHMIPELVRWANRNIDVVHGLVFITFRGAPQDGKYDYFVDGEPVAVEVSYKTDDASEIDLTSRDVYAKIKDHFDHYETSAYLGGSQRHDAIKWLISIQIGSKGNMYGSIGPRAMELVQSFYHFFQGSYLAYTPMHKLPKAAFLLGGVDKGLGGAHRNYWKNILRNPLKAFQPVYTQSIGIVQAPDILEDGRQDMCDSCPDMTYYDGKLVHSCRMDEWRLYGTYITAQRHVGESKDPDGGNGLIAPEEIEVNEGELTPAK
ncbi:MAG: radical SAM protein [Anaerolineae bacterium]|nr:radical SAM protein [Anaerolineae bacterium]